MATKKVYDLAVKTSSYTTADGQTKNRYVNVGAIWEKDDGSRFISINRTFNPAGVPNPDNKEAVLLSQFEVKPRDGQQQGQQQQRQQAPAAAPAPAPAPAPRPASGGFDDMDDDIPF